MKAIDKTMEYLNMYESLFGSVDLTRFDEREKFISFIRTRGGFATHDWVVEYYTIGNEFGTPPLQRMNANLAELLARWELEK